MNHRKSVHLSNKPCRNFPGKCSFGSDCWYVHEEELMDVDESFRNISEKEPVEFKCYICGNDFKSKDDFMKHRETFHGSSVKMCDKFVNETCSRSEEKCWYIHTAGEKAAKQNEPSFKSPPNTSFPMFPPQTSSSKSPPKTSPPKSPTKKSPVKQQPVFREASQNPFPPEQQLKMMLEAVNKLCTKVEIMERRFEELMN